MEKLIARFTGLNIWVKVIVCFCLFGALVNLFLVARDFSTDGILLRLHAGFLVLYLAQVVFVLLHERAVWVLTALQGALALLTNADFTFVPLLRVVSGWMYALMGQPSVEMMAVYKYVFISLAFTMQMLSAYALFSLLPKPKRKEPAPEEKTGEAVLEE
ncbi:hypothetical protein [Candidatus Avelusimicrobium stercoris]|uniref:hypothetical protein n=1 Tax=Candidatus Avelusimicrobium stercoris TaxID=1947924 RepID=UPI003D0ED93A